MSNRIFYFETGDQPYSLIEDIERPWLCMFPDTIMITGWPEIEGELGITLDTKLHTSMFVPMKESFEDIETAVKLDYLHIPSEKYGLRIVYSRAAQAWGADKFIVGEERTSRYTADTLETLIKHIKLSGYK